MPTPNVSGDDWLYYRHQWIRAVLYKEGLASLTVRTVQDLYDGPILNPLRNAFKS